jgi:hypothetical protein
MYLSTVACCFYSTVLFTETKICVRWEDILAISKEKTAFVIPNAIQITTKHAKYIFTTFAQRDSTYDILKRYKKTYLVAPVCTKRKCFCISKTERVVKKIVRK